MADASIYRKTEKGRNEIATRANRLGLRDRTMLIMVDDKTTRAGLLAKNSHPTSDGILNDLLAGGYIEVVRETAAADAAPAPATAEPAAAAPPPAAAGGGAAAAGSAVAGAGAASAAAVSRTTSM